MARPTPPDEFGLPDDENPEWTDESELWSVQNADFGGVFGAVEFLRARKTFFDDARSVGLEREAFLPYEPSKPGFIERATAAIEKLASLRAHAAE
jgi:hypothetical protein